MGFRELDMAGDLLKKYADNKQASCYQSKEDFDAFGELEDIEFNPSSGCVFLVDENMNTLMLNSDNKLESWLNCGNCGKEGFRSEVDFADDNTCKECKDN